MKTKTKIKIPVDRELLKELYVNQRLSTIQVAEKLSQRHGIKVSHEWVNRWLENLGIPLRTPAEANRLNLPLTTEQLEYLYRIQMKSAKVIAKLIGCSKQTILRLLKSKGIPIRSEEEVARLAQKYPRYPFDGDVGERLYYQGYHTGDLYRLRLSKFSIYITLTTTVPASIELFRGLFSKYGEVKMYSQRDYLTGGYEWHLRVYLERPSFDFLVDKAKRLPEEAKGDNFYKFFAGYIDAEGCLLITHGDEYIKYRLKINSQDLQLLEDIRTALKNEGYSTRMRLHVEARKTRNHNGIIVKTNRDIYELSMCKNPEVIEVLKRLPIKNRHKILERQLMLSLWDEQPRTWDQIEKRVFDLRQRIYNEIEQCVCQAKIDYLQWKHIKQNLHTPPPFSPPTIYKLHSYYNR